MTWGRQMHVSGGVYQIKDNLIRLPPVEKRQQHNTRPFLVLSPAKVVQDNKWPVVVGYPLSTSRKSKTEFDVLVQRHEAACEQGCWVRVPAIQPVEKKNLDFYKGQLYSQTLDHVCAAVAAYLGIIG